MTALEETAHLADTLIDVEVELDRKTMTVREILNIGVGGVIEMTRSAGENIDLLVDGTLIGFGEIVIIEEAMGVRVTDFRHED